MPITPAHLGPIVLIGAISGRKLNLAVLITSAVFIDLEHLYLWIKFGDITFHGYFHTFGGATFYGFVYGSLFFLLLHVYWRLEKIKYGHLEDYPKLRENQKHNWTNSFKCIIMSALIGVYAHISLDWVLYDNIGILAVSDMNIYYDLYSQYTYGAFIIIHLFCIFTAILGLSIYGYRLISNKNKNYEISSIYNPKLKKKDFWTILGIISTPFAIAGILIMIFTISIISIHPETINRGLGDDYSIIIVSLVTIFIMSFSYYMALKKVKWKLFE